MQENAKTPRIGFSLLAGALAGFINGFFGAGGGMVLVPLLIWLCRLEDKAAFSSAIAVILPLCIVSIVVMHCMTAFQSRMHSPTSSAVPLAASLQGFCSEKCLLKRCI